LGMEFSPASVFMMERRSMFAIGLPPPKYPSALCPGLQSLLYLPTIDSHLTIVGERQLTRQRVRLGAGRARGGVCANGSQQRASRRQATRGQKHRQKGSQRLKEQFGLDLI
jgi:hypothetical protein